MKPEEIIAWCPEHFADMIGAANASAVKRLQDSARNRRTCKALLLGPYGTAKTSLARLVMRSYCCARPSPTTADPCGRCDGCRRCDAAYNGSVDTYQHWEVRCHQGVGKADVVRILRTCQFPNRCAILCDELGELPIPGQKAWLSHTQDLRGGLFLGTALLREEHPEDLAACYGPLFDRLRPLYLSEPSVEEMTDFLKVKAREEWEIQADRPTLELLVRAAVRSFRSCLDRLAAAAERPERKLTAEIIAETLTLPSPDGRGFGTRGEDPNSEPEEEEFHLAPELND